MLYKTNQGNSQINTGEQVWNKVRILVNLNGNAAFYSMRISAE